MTQIPTHPRSPEGSTKLVVVALVVAGAAVLAVNAYIELMRSQMHEDTFTVYRLTQSVDPGTPLERGMLEQVVVPQTFADAFATAVDTTGLDASLGRELRRPARRQDVLTYDLFSNPGEHELDRRIGVGRRLVALPVNSRTIPGGLRPGMFVDIEAAIAGSDTRVMPIIENVQVIQVGEHTIASDAQTGNRRIGDFRIISIEVSPREATQLGRITRSVVGDFEIHLRNPGDQAYEKIPDGGINPEVLAMIE